MDRKAMKGTGSETVFKICLHMMNRRKAGIVLVQTGNLQ